MVEKQRGAAAVAAKDDLQLRKMMLERTLEQAMIEFEMTVLEGFSRRVAGAGAPLVVLMAVVSVLYSMVEDAAELAKTVHVMS